MLSKPIIISGFSDGIADSPYEGTRNSQAMIVGFDYRTYPGVIMPERPLAKVSGDSAGSPVVTGYIKWFVAIQPGVTNAEIYALCDDQGVADVTRIIRSADSGATWSLFQVLGDSESPCNANGGIFWKGYFLFCSDRYLGYYKPSGSPEWVLNWKDLSPLGLGEGTDVDWHPMLQGQRDGSLYIGAKSFVALLSEVADKTFDPTDSATYSWNAQAIDIPSDFRIKSLAEIGQYLMLGCWKKVGTVHHPVAVLYPWNYVLRPLAHEAPIFKNKILGISAQLNVNNVLYAWIGIQGEVFHYNVSEFTKLLKVPTVAGIEIRPGAVTEFKDIPCFGVDNIVASSIVGGIYEYGTTNPKRYPLSLNLAYPLACGQSDTYEIWAIGKCGINDNILLVGWYNSTDGEYGIDKLNLSGRYDGAYFESMLMHLGTVQKKGQIEKCEIYLDGALSSGAINVKYRRKASGDWTTIKRASATYTFSDTNKSEFYLPFNIDDIVNIQFKVESSGGVGHKIKTVLLQ